ncbi:hypothetical protein BGZ50_000858 [Haplosporangium sp. Z 11]|nr:hypothetical protein BGZ50_000858 [Haplosporangium sp. Z 11]
MGPTSGSPSIPQPTKAKVLIVGAGLGGLILAALLERAGIQYEIFERAKKIIPLGSAISMGPNVMYLFEQLGIANEIKGNSKVILEGYQFNQSLEEIGYNVYDRHEERYGHYMHLIPRSMLYDTILNLVPKEKIHLQTKVLSIEQNNDEVMIRTSNNMTYRGDILVGADGAYSAVRQSLYQQLAKAGQLPKSDKEQLPYTNICLVGTTEPLDVAKYPYLDKPESYFVGVLGDDIPYSWIIFSTKDARICWMVVKHLTNVSRKENNGNQNSEWGPEAADAMCEQVRDFRFPHGLTMGDLIDQTPKELISKVMLEEKVFETWFAGRTVLVGDACHKMHPAAGLGAVSAMHDAVVLANQLFGLESTGVKDLKKAFQAYRDERYPQTMQSYETSQTMAKLLGRSWMTLVVRMLTKRIPKWLWLRVMDKMQGYRPQATFLPLVPDRGSSKPAPQASLKLANKFPQPKLNPAAVSALNK